MNHWNKPLVLMLWIVLLTYTATLVGCGGTEVYDTTRTIVYNGNIYNVTDTKTFSSTIEGTLPDGSKVNLRNADRDRIEALLEEHDSMVVTTGFNLDDETMPYQRDTVESRRDFDRMVSDLESAGNKIARLMREKKTEQLKLR